MNRFPRTQSISSIHNKILKEKERALVKEILARAPEFELQQTMSHFISAVNQMTFWERLRVVWKVLRGRM